MDNIVKIPFLLVALTASRLLASDAPPPSDPPVEISADQSIWVDGIGSGYVESARMLDFEFSRGFGVTYFGGSVTHDMWLGRLIFSQTINEVWAPDKWYGGNLLYTAGIVGGVQDIPDTAYLIFGMGGLRYEFATKGRWIPFVDISAGIGGTAIGAPDLSGPIQFTEQGRIGVRYYFNERFSATAGIGYLHISNGGYESPNDGVNAYLITLGFGWAL
jgi:hypothetical protein